MRNNTDNMEMPCFCDCGEWFDLHDGYASKSSNKVICKACYKTQIEEQEQIERDEMEDSFWVDEEDEFEPCDNCDLPDACADFGCAIKNGIKPNPDF